jgi:hypothetical protein
LGAGRVELLDAYLAELTAGKTADKMVVRTAVHSAGLSAEKRVGKMAAKMAVH